MAATPSSPKLFRNARLYRKVVIEFARFVTISDAPLPQALASILKS